MTSELLAYMKAWIEDRGIRPGWSKWFAAHEVRLAEVLTRGALLRLKINPEVEVPKILQTHGLAFVTDTRTHAPTCPECDGPIEMKGTPGHSSVWCANCGPLLMT